MVGPVVLGCLGRATFGGQTHEFVMADFGPSTHLGEGSIKLAELFGINPNPRTGGYEGKEIFWEFFPGKIAVINGETFQLQPMYAPVTQSSTSDAESHDETSAPTP
jgi:hypothetical protein